MPDEPIPVSGSFDYTWEELAAVVAGDTYVADYSEDETWLGDFEGTAVSPFLFVQRPSGSIEAWIYTEFEGTVLGEYEGTFVMMAVYKAPSDSTEWHGEWVILSGTGDLANLRGFGTAWGPGSSNEDDGITDIYYSGEVYFVEAASGE
jgi:urocanate hydratase